MLLVDVQLEVQRHDVAHPLLGLRVLAHELAALGRLPDVTLHLHRVLGAHPVEQVRHSELGRDPDVFSVWQFHADHAPVHRLRCRRCHVRLAIVYPEDAQRLGLRHAQLERVLLRHAVDDTRRSCRAEEAACAAYAVYVCVLAVAFADVVHERRRTVCDVTHGAHGPDGGVHCYVIVLSHRCGGNPWIYRHQTYAVLRDLGRQVVDQRVVDCDAVAVLPGEDDVHVAARIKEQLAPDLVCRDVVVHHRRGHTPLELLERIFQVHDPHIARLVHGLTEQRPAGANCQRLHDLHRRLAHAPGRRQHGHV